jgi:outer membrane protein insertion porin family
MKIKNVITLALLVCLFHLSSLFGQILQYENHIIKKIEIILHTKCGIVNDSCSVSSRMSTKEGGFFSQSSFDEDLKTLALEYDRIEPTIEAEDDSIIIHIDIWDKPTIRTIRWHGNHHMKTSCLQSELVIKNFDVYNRQEFNTAFHKLKNYYIKKGYFEAELDYQVENDCEANEVIIDICIREGRSGKIQEIQFINFTEKEESEILHKLITKKYNLFLSWINNEGTYNEEAIQQDKLVITNYLQNEGYADAQVELTVVESCKAKDRIIVTFEADKGERYYYGRLSFDGNKIICDEEIDRLFEIREGEPYSIENIRDTLEVLTDAYGRLGYIDAFVDFEPELIEGEYRYNIHFTFEEGEQYRIGLLHVFGNTTTKTPVILHETLLIPGEIFNISKLKATEVRLSNIGYFKNVNVYVVKGTESSLGKNYRDVFIEVEETGTGQFSAFLGYSTTEQIFGGINITEKNFNHEGFYYFMRDGMAAFRGGGEYAHLTAQIGQKSRNYTFSWTKPYFMDTQWIIGFDLSKSCSQYISKDYEIDTIALVLRAQYNINQFVRTGVQYRLKNGILRLHHGGEHIKGLEKASHLSDLISAVGYTLSYDSTNHPVKPSHGFKSKLLLEYAGLGGNHCFFSLGYFNSYFLKIGSRMVLKYRADIKFIQPLFHTTADTIPVDERIFLGGEFNIRGYRPYRLGPQFGHDNDAPKGGISMQLLSVELSRRLTQDYEAFTFMDAGHLSGNTWEFGRMSMSVGVGMNCKFLDCLPPITLGVGYPLNPRNRSEVKKFFISVGGNF